MKKYTRNIYFAVGLMFLAACENVDFGDTNVDPDATAEVVSSGLMTYAERYVGDAVTDYMGLLYTQQISQITYTDGSRYGTLSFDSDYLYQNPLINLKTIIEVNSDETMAPLQTVYGSNANQIAVAKILMVYFYHQITDRWGMMPYTEALQGVENTYPVFDSQEALYDGLFNDLDDALAMIDNGEGPTGDIIFNGDMDRWKQFANTLKLTMALRLSNVYPEPGGYASEKFNEALSGAISSTAENIYYPFLIGDNNDNPWQDRFQTREDYAVSDVMVNRLLEDEDPRISAYAEYTRSSVSLGDPEYVGMPYGIPNSEWLAADVSFITSDVIYDGTFPGHIYTYPQVAFSMAEAVELGWIGGSSSDYYEEGIQASFELWGAENAAAYIAENPLSSDAVTAMEQIAVEKWKGLYLQGWEAWSEWRRLGYPELEPATEPINGNDIPVRQGYDTDYPTNNTENYNAAVSAQGADNLNTNLWWDQPHPITNK